MVRVFPLLSLATLVASLGACTATLETGQEGIDPNGSGSSSVQDQWKAGNSGGSNSGGGEGMGPGAGGWPSTVAPSTGGSGGSGGGLGVTGGSGGMTNSGAGGSGPSGSGGADTGPACKRGISFDRWVNQPSNADLDAMSSSVHWFYNWQYTVNPSISGGYQSRGYEWVPMIRDGGIDFSDANESITEDAEFLLGFNEPMIRGNGGVDMTVEQVVALWPQVEDIAENHGLTLVSPALSFTNIAGERNGPEWLDRFFELCPSCRVDVVAMHTYTCEARWVADHLEPYRRFGRPIWVTEFACLSDDANLVRKFMEDTVDLLENDRDVERYAWFMSRAGNTSVLGASGQLTPLGELYVSLPEAKPCL